MALTIALLNCGHYVEYGSSTPVANPTGPQEDCPECKTTEMIVTEWKEQWNATCKHCPHVTHHGFNKKGALASKERHERARRHSVVVGWFSYAPADAKREVKERRQRTTQPTLPFPVAPPF